MRIKELLLSLIILTTISCATVNQKREEGETSAKRELTEAERAFEALLLFSYSDYAGELDEREMESLFLKEAVKRYPESKYLKKQYILSELNLTIYQQRDSEQIKKIGQEYIDLGEDDAYLLRYLTEYFMVNGDTLAAGNFFNGVLAGNNYSKKFNLTYYLYQKRFTPPADTIYLEKAAAEPWAEDDIFLILQIANEYLHRGDFVKSAEYLLRGYRRWEEEIFLHDLYLKYSEDKLSAELRELMRELLEEDKLPLDLMQVLIKDYAIREEYDKILELEEECRKTGDEYSLRVLFTAANIEGKFDLASEIGELLLLEEGLRADVEMMIRSNMFSVEYSLGEWEKANRYLANLESSLLQYQTLESTLVRFPSIDVLISFLENIYRVNTDMMQNRALLFLIIYNNRAGNSERISELLSLLPYETFSDTGCLRILAQEVGNMKNDLKTNEQEVLLSYIEEGSGLLGLFYYYSNEKDKALEYFRDAFGNTKLTVKEILSYYQILEDREEYDEIYILLNKAVEEYSENAVLLNLYGYAIADYEWRNDYQEADAAILKALEMEPSNDSYWDSLGWLYYRMGRYTEALEAMENTISEANENAIIALHYGVILFVNGRYREAREYLEIVSNISQDAEIILEAQKTLTLIEKIKTED